ncbi:MAG TPA: DUF5069 domain-containing protein [Opitutaceae bacterium]|jgi:hypothetical protein
MKISAPQAKLAGCVWVARIMDRARALRAGTLPGPYAARFCKPDSVDGLFLAHFSLTKEQVLGAADQGDAGVRRWFKGLPGVNPRSIRDWNRIAVNLGRPGFPMADRLQGALEGKYRRAAATRPRTIFQMLNADEKSR